MRSIALGILFLFVASSAQAELAVKASNCVYAKSNEPKNQGPPKEEWLCPNGKSYGYTRDRKGQFVIEPRRSRCTFLKEETAWLCGDWVKEIVKDKKVTF